MRRRALFLTALLAVVTPLAGCLDGASAPEAAAGEGAAPRVVAEEGALERDAAASGSRGAGGSGHGGSRCTGLGSWSQPGLYDALPDAQGREGARVHQRNAPFGLPIGHHEVDAWPHAALTRFEWVTPPHEGAGERRASFSVHTGEARGDIVLSAMAAPAWDRAALEPAFHEFVQAVTSAGADTRDAWFEAFLASKEPGFMSRSPEEGEKVEQYGYRLELREGRDLLELGRAWDERGGLAGAEENLRSTSKRWLRWNATSDGSWEARFEMGVRSLETTTVGGEPLWVEVNGLGDASAWTGASAPAGDARATVAEAMERVGLPRPSFEGWRTDLGVC